MMIPWHFALSFSFLLWGLDGKDEARVSAADPFL